MTVPLDGDTRVWDDFVTRAEDSSFCHLAGWRDIMSDVLGAECLHRGAINGGGWEGVLPLVKITVVLPLPSSSDGLFQSFPSKLRSQIRRPMKEGLTVRFGLDQCDPFYEVFARSMRDLGTPVLPRRLFERISATFPDFVVFGIVYRGDEPLAGGCGFMWRGEFEMTWAGAVRAARPLAANMLLYWAFMEYVIARGARVFNFGRCTPGGGHTVSRNTGVAWTAVAVASTRRRGRRSSPTFTRRCGILLGAAAVAPSSALDREFSRASRGSLPAVTGWRHQAPVHSPLSIAALLAGARAAAARNGGASRAEARVVALLRERYAAKAVLLTDSGTAALTAALLAILKDRPGSPVALPAYGCYDLATSADGANAPVLLFVWHLLAALRKVGLRPTVAANLIAPVAQHRSGELDFQRRPSRPQQEVLDSIPPQPELAVQKSCGYEHGGWAVEFSEHAAGELRLLGVAVVQRERDGATHARIALGQPPEQLLEPHERVAITPQQPEDGPQHVRIVACCPAVEILEAVQAEDRGPVPHERREERRQRLA